MLDYYGILGVSKSASNAEIKAAFRKLAKQYHPDKNPSPSAKALFEKILKAYNVLVNPHSRRRYDEGYFTTSAQTNQSTRKTPAAKPNKTKEWNFTDEELKRRQYYQTYYKKKQKEKEEQVPEVQPYSDYKYILYATPIAVALLMFVLSFFTNEPTTDNIEERRNVVETERKSEQIYKNGDTPYSGYFGASKTYQTENSLIINNNTEFDAVIVIYNALTNEYIQHVYVQKSYFLTVSFLPQTGVYWKAIIGNDWNKDLILFNNKIVGCFDSLVQYQNWKLKPIIFDLNTTDVEVDLFVINESSKDKKYMSTDIDFFTK